MFKKILLSLVAVITLGSSVAFTTSSVSASHRVSQAKLNKMGYIGKAKTNKTITVYRMTRNYNAGKSKRIKKGTHILVDGGVGHWDWIVTYKGRQYLYQHDRDHMSISTTVDWFTEI